MKAFAICLFILASFSALADERILNFQSDILIQQDGWIRVTETIKVRAEGKRIRRGIYRDIPTKYHDKLGNRYVVDVKALSVDRNDKAEYFHTDNTHDGIRIYFGSKNRKLASGEHEYRFTYLANRMLGYFNEHDELYWNVTGFDWAFPIDHAEAIVGFEFELNGNITHEAYTGPFGGTGRDYVSSYDGKNKVKFESNAPLSATNGLTIVVGWPKGYVAEPSQEQRMRWLLEDDRSLLIALGGLLALLAYYVPVWWRYGKDPAPGLIITRYYPPEHYSPASLRYIKQTHYDDKVMTAAIVNLAVKGYLKIIAEEDTSEYLFKSSNSTQYSLLKTTPTADAPDLAAGEKQLYLGLFKKGNVIALNNNNSGRLSAAQYAHKRALNRDYSKKYLAKNWALNLPAVAVGIITIVAVFVVTDRVSVLLLAAIALMLMVMIFFISIMKRPTLLGRETLDQILGFKDYLEIAEKDGMNSRNRPEKTPQLFESYLPYALALDVGQEWTEQFASVLADIKETDETAYQPDWYGGNWSSRRFYESTQFLDSGLNNSITSAVNPPGSSSGGGGGGSSGGGGGGGGGGGW